MFRVFENGIAHIGCQVNKIRNVIGLDRPMDYQYLAKTSGLISEADEIEGFRSKDKVILLKDVGAVKKGTLMRVAAVFRNGDILVEKLGMNRLDTSSLRLKHGVVRVTSQDIMRK